jgi:hypothetical protein
MVFLDTRELTVGDQMDVCPTRWEEYKTFVHTFIRKTLYPTVDTIGYIPAE